jgi:hypothetical protein
MVYDPFKSQYEADPEELQRREAEHEEAEAQEDEDQDYEPKLPWEILEFVTDPQHILIGKDGYVICRIPKTLDPNAEANARFIVRACNSHEKLLAALEAVYAWQHDDKEGDEDAVLDQVAAAIAKARGTV